MKLQHLPVDMLYMAYYLKEAVGCKLKENDDLDFVVLHRLEDVENKYMRNWKLLYSQLFGGNRKSKRVEPVSKFETVDRRSVSPNVPQGEIQISFEI